MVEKLTIRRIFFGDFNLGWGFPRLQPQSKIATKALADHLAWATAIAVIARDRLFANAQNPGEGDNIFATLIFHGRTPLLERLLTLTKTSPMERRGSRSVEFLVLHSTNKSRLISKDEINDDEFYKMHVHTEYKIKVSLKFCQLMICG
ncbi:MAG TPA: hypothetical protein VJB93_00365 [Patescibacteria group bacterium]|nr:hypothetical protein [Patescibacteria group bacterium]